MHGSSPRECDARCVSAEDVGLPEYAPSMMSIDPLCQVHNPHEFTISGDWKNGEIPHCGECGILYTVHV